MMRIPIIIVVLFLFYSCKNNNDKLLSLDIAFVKINEIYKYDVEDLKYQNNHLLSEINSDYVSDINNLVLDYLNYLDNIQKLCNDSDNPFFYKGKRSNITKVGEEFMEKARNYLKKLNDNKKISSFHKKRAYTLLNVEDFKYYDEWYLDYLDYYFRDVNCETFFFLIENRKRDLLIIYQGILYDILLEECK